MTYIADQIIINNNYLNGNWFNTFAATGLMAGFDEGKILAGQETRFLDWMRQSGILFNQNIALDDFTNEYSFNRKSGPVGSSGVKLVGNPDIVKEERQITQQLVKVNHLNMRTNFHSIEWEEEKRDHFMKGVISSNFYEQTLHELAASHSALLYKMLAMYALSRFTAPFDTFTNGSTTSVAQNFNMDTQYLSSLDRNLTFKSILNIPRLLADKGKIPYSMVPNLRVFLGLPDFIFDKSITDYLTAEPIQYQWVLGTKTSGIQNYEINSNKFQVQSEHDAQAIKGQCDLATGISVFRLSGLETYQIWDQDAKKFKCPMWIGKNAFSYGRPASQEYLEYIAKMPTDRTISSGDNGFVKERLYFEERRISAAQSRKKFESSEYSVSGRIGFRPQMQDEACALEINATAMSGLTQQQLEAKMNGEYRVQYANAFYQPGYLSTDYDFLKSVV